MSVVVMGYRNATTIEAAVRSVLDQACGEAVETIVVTSGDDGSAELIRRAFPGLALVASKRRLLAAGARNVGWQSAAGEFVAFLAADCIAHPGWAEARLRAHRRGYRAVAGPVTNAGPDRPWSWASAYLNYRGRLATLPAGPVSWPQPAAHSLSIDRRLLTEMGGFDTSRQLGEDTELARRLSEAGVKIWFEPRAEIGHFGPESTRRLLQDQYRRGRAFVLTNEVSAPGDGRWGSVLAVETVRTGRSIRAAVGAAARFPSSIWGSAVIVFPWVVVGAIALRLGRISGFRAAAAHG